MSAENAKAAMELIAGKDLTNAQAVNVAKRYLADFDPHENPWSPVDNPDEYNAWPTPDERGQMFLDTMLAEAKAHVRNAARAEYLANAEQAAQDAADEL